MLPISVVGEVVAKLLFVEQLESTKNVERTTLVDDSQQRLECIFAGGRMFLSTVMLQWTLISASRTCRHQRTRLKNSGSSTVPRSLVKSWSVIV